MANHVAMRARKCLTGDGRLHAAEPLVHRREEIRHTARGKPVKLQFRLSNSQSEG